MNKGKTIHNVHSGRNGNQYLKETIGNNNFI